MREGKPQMVISVQEATRRLDERGLVKRWRDNNLEQVVEHMTQLLGQNLPADLIDFYQQNLQEVGGFLAITPHWNAWVGWRKPDLQMTQLLHMGAAPIVYDGCGSVYGLDLTSGLNTPAVYFFDHEDRSGRPTYAAGSSLGVFLLLLADHDRAIEENWPERWELKIDPDIDKCPRAPAIWAAG